MCIEAFKKELAWAIGKWLQFIKKCSIMYNSYTTTEL